MKIDTKIPFLKIKQLEKCYSLSEVCASNQDQ